MKEDYMTTISSFIDSLDKQLLTDEKFLNLTANENVLSRTANKFMGSIWSQRYHLGTQRDYYKSNIVINKGGFLFKGFPAIYELEKKSIAAMYEMFNISKIETRFLSGVHATQCSIGAFTKPGDFVFSLNPDCGGHFATKDMVQLYGRKSCYIKLKPNNLQVDLDLLSYLYNLYKPKLIIFDHGATLFPFNLNKVRQLVGQDVMIIYDASHVLGLIAGKVFPNPLDNGCDYMQSNTHKSFPGPHKAVAVWRDSSYNNIIDCMDSAFVSSQHTHHAVALYITILEMAFFIREYSTQMILNAQKLSLLLKREGMPVLSFAGKETETHLFFVECNDFKDAKNFCEALYRNNITTNAKSVFGKNTIRIGVQEITRRGFMKEDIEELSDIIVSIWNDRNLRGKYRNRIAALLRKIKNIKYSFDETIFNI